MYCVASAASAQNFDSMRKAQELATILGSEEYCSLSYDQDAIAAWIDANTDPSDMGFASILDVSINGVSYGLEDRSASAKTAHCRSVSRTAQHFGFID